MCFNDTDTDDESAVDFMFFDGIFFSLLFGFLASLFFFRTATDGREIVKIK